MNIEKIEAFSEEVQDALNRLLPQLSERAGQVTEHALRQLIAADATHLLMAKAQGRYCGSLTLVIVIAPTGKRARIEDVVVSESMRGRGIGQSLVAYAQRLAWELGADSLELTSHPSRQAAQALYKKMGFSLRETHTYNCPLGRSAVS